jgi:hypothetical protein
MDFSTLFPGLAEWVASLREVWPASVIRSVGWIFPVIQIFHLLALSAIGGAVLLTGLRMMDTGLTGVPLARIERGVRPVMIAALLVIVISGLLMGMVVAGKLYARPAFLIKMMAFVPALVVSLGVIPSIIRHDGAIAGAGRWMLGLSAALWLASVWVFGTSYGAAPGTFHIICAGWLIVMAFGSNPTRIVLGAITAVTVVVIGVLTYGVYHPLEEYDLVMEINRWALRGAALVVTAALVWEFARPSSVKLAGAFTIVAWITVAAAGRWIGLGGSA